MIWKIIIIFHFKCVKCMWTRLLWLVFDWNHYTSCGPFARPLGSSRDSWTTLGEIFPIWRPQAQRWSPWTFPDGQNWSSTSICGLFTTRLLGWLSPNSLNKSGCSVHALLHAIYFPLLTPIGSYENIWGTFISHLGSTNCKAQSGMASCLHIHRETLVS